MKKFLVFLLLCVCFIFAGCTDVATVGLVQNADGSVVEFYYIPYAETELVEAGITWEESETIKLTAKSTLNDLFANYINAYKARVIASEDYTDEQKQILLDGVNYDSSFNYAQSTQITIGPNGQVTTRNVISYIQYELYFSNKTCYLEFKNANEILKEEKEIVEENHFFTTISKVIKDPVFDNMVNESLTLGTTMANRFQDTIVSVLAGQNATAQDIENAQARWDSVKLAVGYDNSKETFTYTYIVPTARLHSNADAIIHQDGYYYHIWEISANNSNLPDGERVQFEYWTISANRWVWYITALVGAAIIILITWLVAKKQEKQEINNLLQTDFNSQINNEDKKED
ncbi:MAG: hypothetical protein E7376_02065 [Clostridiales bacterium]|nr:hypothetical protein [Clostridiales bacterium]